MVVVVPGTKLLEAMGFSAEAVSCAASYAARR